MIGRLTPTLNKGGKNAALLQPRGRRMVDNKSKSHCQRLPRKKDEG